LKNATETSKETLRPGDPESCVSDDIVYCFSDDSVLGMSDVPDILAEDPVLNNPNGATDFFSAPHIDSREVLGAPDPLIHSQQSCITEDQSAKPNAHFTITSRNIRNLLIHRQDVCDCEDNVQVLQECDLLEHQQSTVNEALNQGPWQRHYGNVCDISHEEGKRRGRRVATMVNAAQDNAIHMQTDEEDYKFLMDSGRWVEITLPTSKKGHFITIANFYGIAGASQSQKSHEYKENERLAAAAGRRAASMPKHPYFLFG